MKLSTFDLRVFASIADLGGITAAARKLGLTKSTVSRELAALEDRLGSRLVQRTTRRLSLTETGELLAGYARRIVEDMDAAEAAIEATHESPRGELRVSVPFSVLRYLMAPRMAEFRARYPDIRLSIDASTRIVDLVEEGIDVVIRIGDLPTSSLVARRLATVPQIFVASPDYLSRRGRPAAPADLSSHDIISLGREAIPSLWTLESDTAARAVVPVTPVVAIHEPGLVLDLAVRGLGIAPAPELYARAALQAGDLIQVLADYRFGLTPIHAVYPSRRILAPKVKAFVEFAVELFAAVDLTRERMLESE
jgi:DNA-binding transcriptional LysR family regulator